MNGTSPTYSQVSYYSKPGTVPTTAPQIQKSPNPPGFGAPTYNTTMQSSRGSSAGAGIFTILLVLGLLALCVAVFLLVGTRFGPFELTGLDAPVLQQLPQYTNQTNIVINGNAPANSAIEVYSNGERVIETTADAEGKFAGQFKVDEEKLYSINAVVVRNLVLKFRSPYSNTVEITYDRTSPQLVINNKPKDPVNAADFNIQGKTSEKAKVTADIKGIKTDVNTLPDGTFTLPVKLSPGNNDITITAVDLANNASKPETYSISYVVPSINGGGVKTTNPATLPAQTTQAQKPAKLPNSAGSLPSAMEGAFGKVLLMAFVVLGLLGFGASYSFVWLAKNLHN